MKDEISECLRKYYRDIQTVSGFEVGDQVLKEKIENARNKFAPDIVDEDVIGFYDITFTGNGRAGYLFTDAKMYFLEAREIPETLLYDDIQSVDLEYNGTKDCDNKLVINRFDGTTVKLDSIFLNKTPLLAFFNEIQLLVLSIPHTSVDAADSFNREVDGAMAGGLGIANYAEVNKAFNEEKFHARQGHGFAAERSNNFYDQMHGKNAHIVGDDNAKNGADRMIKTPDGNIYIQSKYCQTGNACVNACFEENGKGKFRYLVDGKPMQIEVPSDKYDVAVQAMEDKIKNGQVQGVTDPKEAKNIIRKGNFTYEQAKNIAKAGNIDSIKYDAANGAVIATAAFGITTALTFAFNIWQGEDFSKSLELATYSGLKVGGTAFITTVLASQLSKAGLNSALVGSSETIVALMGPKASAVLINAFRGGSNIYGAAAMKSAAKLLRGNVITAGVTVVVLSSFDIANIFMGRISGKQLFKNVTNTTVSVVAGTGGWIAGAAIGTAIFPGIGTAVGIVGGLICSVAAGATAGKVTDVVLDNFIEDDAEEMIRIIQKEFQKIAEDYLLSQKEGETTADRLKDILDDNKLKDMFASEDRHKYAREMLIPIVEGEVKKRRKTELPSNQQMALSLREVLEEISVQIELQPAAV